ncbi:glycosyl transferase family 90 [Paracoccus benzoatiresistens]|uniref:Glycosyl transferase family 90 n=1 Tax=Paracoccus benzoatiresistens TaxID=2997341 RepID=A0ABT4J4I7_9RHOB|nr:glycosyl transferase family 90 [Paracoccus sp. EF6]MCZ0962043.1 glycosyl transferase family 90 [Paracoccus sp. EF6]
MSRKFFQIGYNKCGTTFIARLFQMNGYPAVHWAEGALAEDIAWSKLAGVRPLQPWADTAVAFTDMESVRYLNMPVIEAFKEYRFLDESYPGAVFLLNTRRIEDWVISRYMHRGGSYARAVAQIRGVAVGDLADLWAAEWEAHLAACRAYFANRAEFIEIDIDQASPGDYRDALAPWFDLKECPPRPGAGVRSRREGYLAQLSRMLTAPPATCGAQEDRNRINAGIVSAARPARIIPADHSGGSGHQAVVDLDKGEVRDRRGEIMPLRRAPDGFFYAHAAMPQLLRIATTANDIAQVAEHGVYHIDMQPGYAGGQTGPVLACCRRRGAANVFLWPMPWIHRLGNDGHLGRPDRIDPHFPQKLDRAVWRGDLSGHVPGPDGQPRRPVHQAVADLLAGDLRAGPDLRASTRVALALEHQGSPDVDAALTPDARGARALERAGLSHLAATRSGDDFLLSHRYLICLGATSGAEDLLPLMNSNSVVLLEEDGWETFARGVVQPWRHYIPLRPGAGDLAERLAWARANPDACQQMSSHARGLCVLLAERQARRDQLSAILRDYRLATGQPA